MRTLEEYDIAVVGGGIAGLYCCLHAPPEARIALFEATGRIGGKLETVSMEGFQAEYGSMRFDPSRQPAMERLLKELQLDTEPFPEYSSPPVRERRTIFNLEKEERGMNALELHTYAIARVLGKTPPELMTISEDEIDYLRREGKYRGRFLWKQGVWNVFCDVLSYDAIKYIISDGSFFHVIHENPGVVGNMLTWVKMLQMSKYLKGIKGGMQSITDKMLEKVKSRGVQVFTHNTLSSLGPARGKKVALTFDAGQYTARHAILAIPSRPLKAIGGLPDDIRALLDSVIEIPLLKCFFVVKEPWWDENIPNKGVQTFPARELHYYKQGGKGMIMAYADRPYINFWSKYVKGRPHHRAEINGNEELPQVFSAQTKIDPGTVTDFGIRDWTREPYGAGVHLWRPGFEPWKVGERLSAFSLPGASTKNVHICGEAFSDYQGFMEGAVRSAQSALAKALD
ncbi:MAG: FAD-dependent oxidoreductase [Chloroflexi bacterium]|nr:FAD-dependent oxidoreductase [Chloroflexota bacterium]